jgi:hypothetical protein
MYKLFEESYLKRRREKEVLIYRKWHLEVQIVNQLISLCTDSPHRIVHGNFMMSVACKNCSVVFRFGH